jgi:hypothetical protein
MFAPLALLPFGVVYAMWMAINVLCLAVAYVLLAPRVPSTRVYWARWLTLVVLFLPIHVRLMMGQMSCVLLLLGFSAFARAALRGGQRSAWLALIPWTWKPQLLPVVLLVLGFLRTWAARCWVCGLPALVSLLVVVVAGPDLIVAYVRTALEAATGVLKIEGVHLEPGHGLLGTAHWLVGPGGLAFALTVLGTLAVGVLMARVWHAGLHSDPRRDIQLAMIPLAAVLVSPHAAAYDAVTWLASFWLMLHYARHVPRARRAVAVLGLVGWWAATWPPCRRSPPSRPGAGSLLWRAWRCWLGCMSHLRLTERLPVRRRSWTPD